MELAQARLMAACWPGEGIVRAGARALEGKSEVRRLSKTGGKREGVRMWVVMSVRRNLKGGKDCQLCSYLFGTHDGAWQVGRKDEAQNGSSGWSKVRSERGGKPGPLRNSREPVH